MHLSKGGGACNQIWGLKCQAWGQERGVSGVHLSGEHQVSTRARAGQGEGWRGEDTGLCSPESCGQQDGQVMWPQGLALSSLTSHCSAV